MGIPESSTLILFVGSGFERKGLQFLLQSTAYLKDKNWRLLLMGKGKFEKKINNLVLILKDGKRKQMKESYIDLSNINKGVVNYNL